MEEAVVGPAGERKLLTSRKPVRILHEAFVLSTSLDITERKRIESELTRRAYYDELTGLPKANLIQERIDNLISQQGEHNRFALVLIDIDNFKHINDYYSHAIGDALLMKVAARIRSRIRASDLVARISGDEFALLVEPLDDSGQISGTVDALLQSLKQPFHIDGYEIFSSASIGVSVHPQHGESYETLRRNADSAMSKAKGGGKGSAAVFDRSTGLAITARMRLEQRLRLEFAIVGFAAHSSRRSISASDQAIRSVAPLVR